MLARTPLESVRRFRPLVRGQLRLQEKCERKAAVAKSRAQKRKWTSRARRHSRRRIAIAAEWTATVRRNRAKPFLVEVPAEGGE